MIKKELYFCLKLTENEHYVVEEMIRDFCHNNDLELKYYRKCKLHHFPMYREIRIIGKNINLFKKWTKSKESDFLVNYVEKIPEYGRPRKKIEIDKKCAEYGI